MPRSKHTYAFFSGLISLSRLLPVMIRSYTARTRALLSICTISLLYYHPYYTLPLASFCCSRVYCLYSCIYCTSHLDDVNTLVVSLPQTRHTNIDGLAAYVKACQEHRGSDRRIRTRFQLELRHNPGPLCHGRVSAPLPPTTHTGLPNWRCPLGCSRTSFWGCHFAPCHRSQKSLDCMYARGARDYGAHAIQFTGKLW